jgi:hypothetical protein
MKYIHKTPLAPALRPPIVQPLQTPCISVGTLSLIRLRLLTGVSLRLHLPCLTGYRVRNLPRARL